MPRSKNMEEFAADPSRDTQYQTFCIYCQREYSTFVKLKAHLRRVHKGTYAQQNLAP